MPVNLAVEGQGELGRKCFVSDVIAGALHHQFTGGVALSSGDRQLALLFKEGRPVHAAGPLVPEFRIGELLLRSGAAKQSQVASVLTQLENEVGSKPLSGAMMVKEGLDPADVKRAVQEQVRLRIRAVLHSTSGSWKSTAGENAKMREVGVRTDPLPTILEDLPQVISDRELRWAADKWLGKAVTLRAGGPGPVADRPIDAAVPAILRYLERPRKPDQLERATGKRRVVRLVLRLLDLLGRLEGLPVSKAVPIPKATLLKGQTFTGYGSMTETWSSPTGTSSAVDGAAAEAPEAEPTPPPPEPPKLTAEQKKLFAEVESLHEKMNALNHFEILGVKQDASTSDIRQAYTHLLRYHPDKLGTAAPEPVREKARDLTARLNEANRVLGSDKSRREYLQMLTDVRIKGDARRAELVRDAETKCQMGVVMLRKRDFKKARELFTFCSQADPVTPIYKAHLAFAMFADRQFDRDEAFEKGYPLLLEALKAKDGDPVVHHYAGQMLKERDRLKEALHHFKKAAALDPKNVDHKREVRLLQGRLAKEKDDAKNTGSLGRFFKR